VNKNLPQTTRPHELLIRNRSKGSCLSVWFMVKNKKEMFVKQITLICILTVLSLVVTACSRGEVQTQTLSETPAEQTSAEVTEAVDSSIVKLPLRISYFNDSSFFGREAAIEYDDQNRIVKITSYTQSYANWGFPDYQQTFTLTYSGERLARVERTTNYSDVEDDEMRVITIRGNTINIEERRTNIVYTVNDDGYILSSSTTNLTGSVTSEASYQYQNGNLINTSGLSKNFEMVYDYIKPYEYDDKKTPFYYCNTPNWFLHYFFNSGHNNNITSIIFMDRAEYIYEYDDDGFPTSSSGHGYLQQTITYQTAAAVNSAAQSARYFTNVSGKQQYFIRSNTDLEGYGKKMEILKLDTNPYTAIEMIGWSNNGLFAYRTKHLHDSGLWGGWIYSLIIINTVTDEIIERERFIVNTAIDQDDAKHLNATLLPEEISSDLTKEYIAKWNTILRNHKISGEVGNPIASYFVNNLLKFPINDYNCWFDDPEYTFEKYKFKTGDDVEFKKDVYNWMLIIGNENIKKIISEGKDELYADMPNINGRKILGYYKSPYENRIVVATIYYDWIAFSGGYHTVKLDLFGCNMNVGLTK